VLLAVPLRPVEGRDLPFIATEDLVARDTLSQLMTDLALHVEHTGIDPGQEWRPDGQDLVAICGPKSSPTIERILASDPVLDFTSDDDGRWYLQERETGEQYLSPMDDPDPVATDVGYLGRVPIDDTRSVLLIAGVHAIGSVGIVHWLQTNLEDLYQQIGTDNFSMVIRCDHLDGEITSSEAACPPARH
jgi:hypothetical protein